MPTQPRDLYDALFEVEALDDDLDRLRAAEGRLRAEIIATINRRERLAAFIEHRLAANDLRGERFVTLGERKSVYRVVPGVSLRRVEVLGALAADAAPEAAMDRPVTLSIAAAHASCDEVA